MSAVDAVMASWHRRTCVPRAQLLLQIMPARNLLGRRCARVRRLRTRERVLVRWPHAHVDLPARLDRLLPDHGQNYLAVGSHQVVVAFLNMRANNFDVRKGLLDEIFHALEVKTVLTQYALR